MDCSKFCKKCYDEEDDIKREEEDPIGSTQVELAQWNNDERQNQG